MTNVDLFIFDTRKYTTSELVDLLKLSKEDTLPFDKYQSEEIKKEKIISFYYKKNYVKDWYLSKDGKPLSHNLFFNISHSKGMVAFAYNKDYPIGVDIELIRPVEESLKQYISSENELKYMENEESFFEIWTNKESLVKCIGQGIKGQPKNINALPLNGIRIVDNKTYNSKNLKWNNCVISLTLETENDYQIKVHKGTLI